MNLRKAMTPPTNPEEFRIEVADARTPEATVLLALLTAELAQRYDDDGAGDFKVDDTLQPRSVFLLGWLGGEAVACGALRPLEPAVAEIKRMYVAPTVRGRGLAKRLLAELETHARRMGFTVARLETGILQPEAIRVYESAGYYRIENYGFYQADPRSICFEKELLDQPD